LLSRSPFQANLHLKELTLEGLALGDIEGLATSSMQVSFNEVGHLILWGCRALGRGLAPLGGVSLHTPTAAKASATLPTKVGVTQLASTLMAVAKIRHRRLHQSGGS
jgi:hypothetical protein